MAGDWRGLIDPWDWAFEQINWESAKKVFGEGCKLPKPERGVSAEIETAVLEGRLLFATDGELIAIWTRRAEEMLLSLWRLKGQDLIHDSLWRKWHVAKIEEM
ncbi:MAG: hypothetical protein ACRD0Y_02395, partial [Terriglobales bacterium]